MSISQKTGITPEAVTAPVSEAPAKATGAKGASATSQKSQQFRQRGAALRKQAGEDLKAVEGTKRDKVAFVCALGDPTRSQGRVEAKETLPSYVVVGYKFKILEDMTVPYAPLKADFKSPVDVESISERPVKAGTVISLNLVETGAFISKPEFAGQFTGEGEEVAITAKCSASREEPLPVLRKLNNGGSIKANMDLVAEIIGGGDGQKGTPKVKDEYAETFGVLFQKKSAGKKSRGGASKTAGESANDIAAAFRELYSKKMVQ